MGELKEHDTKLLQTLACLPPLLKFASRNYDSTDSDSDESSEDHSPRLTQAGKNSIIFTYVYAFIFDSLNFIL